MPPVLLIDAQAACFTDGRPVLLRFFEAKTSKISRILSTPPQKNAGGICSAPLGVAVASFGPKSPWILLGQNPGI